MSGAASDYVLRAGRSVGRLRGARQTFAGRLKIAVGASMVSLVVLCAVSAPIIGRYDPIAQNVDDALKGPGAAHWFGTDQFGRDVFARVIWAARLDLQIAVFATILSFVIGVLLGLVGGFRGGLIDQLVGRLIDVVLAFPSLVLTIALIAVLGTSVRTLYIALTLSGWAAYARITRGEVLSVRGMPYVEAARALGYKRMRIELRHVLPNVVTPPGLYLIMDMVQTILVVTSLSYLGLGPAPPTPEWGSIIAEARPFIIQAWWIPLFAGAAVAFTGVGLALLGDGLADELRPDSR